MIILITGASHTGKTLLSQKMMEKYKYPYFCIDHLKMGLIRSGIAVLTTYDDDKLSDFMWPIIREIIKTAIENKQNLIVEGCYIPFNWRHSFETSYLVFIQFICLCMTERYIENHFNEIISFESVIERRLINADCTSHRLIEENKIYIDGFRNAGEQIVLIDSDYVNMIKKLLDLHNPDSRHVGE